jgi:hypothetical protein
MLLDVGALSLERLYDLLNTRQVVLLTGVAFVSCDSTY